MDGAPLKLYTFADPAWAGLRQRFLKTLRDNYAVTVFDSQPLVQTSRVKSGGGIQTWKRKTALVQQCVEENQGEVILFTDIDIQFFGCTLPYVERAVTGKDIAVQNEFFTGINIGFMAIQCSPRTVEFFAEVMRRIEQTRVWDQVIVANMLLAGALDWQFIDQAVWAYHPSEPKPPANIVAHHATHADGAAAKLAQMDKVAAAVRLRR